MTAAAAGLDADVWSTSACFLDYDRDGWLDLYVANYVEFDLVENPASILCSTAPGWMFGARKTDRASRLTGGRLRWTHGALGRDDEARRHGELHAFFKPDDNARDRAVAVARRNNPAANVAAEAVVVYDLQRSGSEAYDLTVDAGTER